MKEPEDGIVGRDMEDHRLPNWILPQYMLDEVSLKGAIWIKVVEETILVRAVKMGSTYGRARQAR